MAARRSAPNGGDTVPLSRTATRAVAAEEPSFSLIVYHRDGVRVVPLAAGVPVTVGRAAPSEVIVPDRSLSRCHARFSLAGGLLAAVEDLGSTNGTVLRGEQVAHADIRPGDTVELGAVVVSLHMRAAVEPEVAGLASHDAFFTALESEISRARYFGDPLAVLMLEPLRAADERGHVSHWWRHLRAALRPVDIAALYGPRAVELAIMRLPPPEAREHAQALCRLAPRTSALGCGIATYPGSGATADELLESARRAALAATTAAPVVLSEPVRPPAPEAAPPAEGLVAASAAMRAVLSTVDQLAGARLPVLLVGETGTGKEVVARAIHQRSPRAAGQMVCVNCGAIPATLVESTLFGHKKGAFTGATESSRGVLGSADRGTVLLDEVGELSPGAQAALLRVIEQGTMRPVGATAEVAVDVRVLAATNRDLEAMCEVGSFRRDLFYRLQAFTLSIPPLRERPEDIDPLVRHFLADAVHGGAPLRQGVSAEALEAIAHYPWPGNVRELRNAIERAAVIARDDLIALDDLPERVQQAGGSAQPSTVPSSAVPPSAPPPSDEADVLAGEGGLRERLKHYESRLIAASLAQANGNQAQAARLLDLPVRTLADKIRRLGIVIPSRGGRRPVS